MTFISKKTLATLVLALAPLSVLAQGKIAVVNLQEAILQSDVAQARLAEAARSRPQLLSAAAAAWRAATSSTVRGRVWNNNVAQ